MRYSKSAGECAFESAIVTFVFLADRALYPAQILMPTQPSNVYFALLDVGGNHIPAKHHIVFGQQPTFAPDFLRLKGLAQNGLPVSKIMTSCALQQGHIPSFGPSDF